MEYEDNSWRGYQDIDEDTLAETLPSQAKYLAKSFIEAGRENNVDPLFLASISRHETGNWTSNAFKNKNNAMGISGSGGVKALNDADAGVSRMAKILAADKGPYKNARTVSEVGSIYAPTIGATNDPMGLNNSWINSVNKYYTEYKGGRRPNANNVVNTPTTKTNLSSPEEIEFPPLDFTDEAPQPKEYRKVETSRPANFNDPAGPRQFYYEEVTPTINKTIVSEPLTSAKPPVVEFPPVDYFETTQVAKKVPKADEIEYPPANYQGEIEYPPNDFLSQSDVIEYPPADYQEGIEYPPADFENPKAISDKDAFLEKRKQYYLGEDKESLGNKIIEAVKKPNDSPLDIIPGAKIAKNLTPIASDLASGAVNAAGKVIGGLAEGVYGALTGDKKIQNEVASGASQGVLANTLNSLTGVRQFAENQMSMAITNVADPQAREEQARILAEKDWLEKEEQDKRITLARNAPEALNYAITGDSEPLVAAAGGKPQSDVSDAFSAVIDPQNLLGLPAVGAAGKLQKVLAPVTADAVRPGVKAAVKGANWAVSAPIGAKIGIDATVARVPSLVISKTAEGLGNVIKKNLPKEYEGVVDAIVRFGTAPDAMNKTLQFVAGKMMTSGNLAKTIVDNPAIADKFAQNLAKSNPLPPMVTQAGKKVLQNIPEQIPGSTFLKRIGNSNLPDTIRNIAYKYQGDGKVTDFFAELTAAGLNTAALNGVIAGATGATPEEVGEALGAGFVSGGTLASPGALLRRHLPNINGKDINKALSDDQKSALSNQSDRLATVKVSTIAPGVSIQPVKGSNFDERFQYFTGGRYETPKGDAVFLRPDQTINGVPVALVRTDGSRPYQDLLRHEVVGHALLYGSTPDVVARIENMVTKAYSPEELQRFANEYSRMSRQELTDLSDPEVKKRIYSEIISENANALGGAAYEPESIVQAAISPVVGAYKGNKQILLANIKPNKAIQKAIRQTIGRGEVPEFIPHEHEKVPISENDIGYYMAKDKEVLPDAVIEAPDGSMYTYNPEIYTNIVKTRGAEAGANYIKAIDNNLRGIKPEVKTENQVKNPSEPTVVNKDNSVNAPREIDPEILEYDKFFQDTDKYFDYSPHISSSPKEAISALKKATFTEKPKSSDYETEVNALKKLSVAPPDVTKQFDLPQAKALGGKEHDVVMDPKDNLVYKATKPDLYGSNLKDTPLDYLDNIDNLNAISPNLDIKVLGISPGDKPRIVTSQNFIPGRHLKSEEKLKALLEKTGYKEGLLGKWTNPDGKYQVQDLHIGNVLVYRGKPVIIDAWVTKL